jgi:hypothetical protein
MGRTCGINDGQNNCIQDFEQGILERDNLEDPGIDK